MKKYIAMDLGLKRIGLAYSPDGKIATPLPAVLRKNRNQAATDVKKVLDEWGAQILVVGIPMNPESAPAVNTAPRVGRRFG